MLVVYVALLFALLVLFGFGVGCYFVWFRGDDFLKFAHKLQDSYPWRFKFVDRYMQTDRYLRDQRIILTATFLLVLAVGILVTVAMFSVGALP